MPDENGNRQSWMRHSGIGIEFAGAVGGFALLGYWIDRHWDTKPWGLLICLALGMTGATYNLIRTSMKAFRSEPPRDRKTPVDGEGDSPGRE